MALIVTPKSTTADSYCNEALSKVILVARRGHTASWSTLNDADTRPWLRWSTRLLDQSFNWDGAVTDINQRLRFPRSGLLDADGRNIDFDTIPTVIEEACAELAYELHTQDRSAQPALLGQGFKKAKLGEMEVEVDAVVSGKDMIPERIIEMVALFGTLKSGQGSGDGTVGLERV